MHAPLTFTVTHLMLAFLPLARCLSNEARLIQKSFTFTISSQPSSNATSVECPSVINHRSISLYRGLDPANSSRVMEGIVWRDLSINGISCLDSVQVEAATRFEQTPSDPPGTSADNATPWFIRGFDNSPRRCGPFAAANPANYFFVNDLPRFKQRFIDQGIIPRNTDLPEAIDSPIRGDVFMLSQQVSAATGGTSTSNIICTYQAVLPSPSPRPSPAQTQDDGGSVCFPPDATVKNDNGKEIPMRNLAIGERVLVAIDDSGKSSYSAVVSFSHHDSSAHSQFRTVSVFVGSCERGQNMTLQLTATNGHYVRMWNGRLRAVGDLQIGDFLQVAECGQRGQVQGMKWGRRRGLYSPVTGHGDIVVNGIVASCYTKSVRASAAHALLAPVRWGFKAAKSVNRGGIEWCGVIDQLRWALR
eukprot:GFKZ01002677.1.p1 GENE.GFKZ01002677.1~~GFKZ01002677.1.p1  ORF type:complete len:417 (+),score=28.88 GFKZ01002677.1:279-1529(+)